MSKLIFTIAQNGYGLAYADCISSQRAYAKKLGAAFVCVARPRRVPEVALSAWLKIPLLTEALRGGYDEVAYIDGDCRVAPDAPDFTSCFGGDRSGDILMARGKSGRINSGVIFAKNSRASLRFLDSVLESVTAVVPDEDRKDLKFENGNVIFIARTEGGVQELPTVWNNTYQAELNDYIRHYTGVLRSEYVRSPLLDFTHKLGKRTIYRQKPQPPARDQQFKQRLSAMTEAVVRAYPAIKSST